MIRLVGIVALLGAVVALTVVSYPDLFTARQARVVAGAHGEAFPGTEPHYFPGVQPQLAKNASHVVLTYGLDNVVGVVSSVDSGQSFGQPARLAVPGRISLGMHRGPRAAVTRTAVMITVVAGKKGDGADGDIFFYRSTDDGATWTTPVVVNDVPGAAREGLHAFAAIPGGFAALAWLDLREKGTRIFTAVTHDRGVTWSRDHLAYASPSGSVCECCHPSIAISSPTSTALMFRNNRGGNRDLYVSLSDDWVTFGPAQKSGNGNWRLDACPMDGGAVAFRGKDVVSVWRRENDIYLTTLGKPEARIGTGRDPAMDSSDGHLDIVWSSAKGVMLKRDDGEPTLLGDGRFPSVVATAGRTVVAWEFQGTVKVLSIPR